MQAQAIQTTLEEGIALHEVTFCVVDLETNGGSPRDCSITEVGAVKVRVYRAVRELGQTYLELMGRRAS